MQKWICLQVLETEDEIKTVNQLYFWIQHISSKNIVIDLVLRENNYNEQHDFKQSPTILNLISLALHYTVYFKPSCTIEFI